MHDPIEFLNSGLCIDVVEVYTGRRTYWPVSPTPTVIQTTCCFTSGACLTTHKHSDA